ncbi:nuclear transport factor 2 family protein [Streptomyces sp. VRA16 Mangrove soil]|uniref:nuclear transport factor 2 family protein n=1 Tax=Streptomyces sp. VRA16 Mangrove soil TaxID=2817434 RepID=UPI001A9DD356|nr:nuclear transport factor 2 family protein [Streptomyces sp. VRA16 Mangrove soil]MBO1334226.1 nuclear transport factor 2 family protein [Streptomyces sp. VRA16 Mangrove soil]
MSSTNDTHVLRTLTDRLAIEALRGEFTDAIMMGDYDRFAQLFTTDGALRIPEGGIGFTGRDRIRAGIEQLQDAWDYFIQTVHPGTIQLAADTATGRSYIQELGRRRDGASHLNYALYHDRYVRTPDQGWRFAERVYEVRYIDTAALTGTTFAEFAASGE